MALDFSLLGNPANIGQTYMQNRMLMGQEADRQAQADMERAKIAQMQQQQQAKQTGLASLLVDRSPQNMVRVLAIAPELKQAVEAAGEDAKRETAALGHEVLSYDKVGRPDLAEDALRKRADALGNMGRKAESDQVRQIADLYKENPDGARSMIALNYAAADPKAYETFFGKTDRQKRYDENVARYGEEKARQLDLIEQDKLVPVQPGGTVYRGTDLYGSGQVQAPQAPRTTPQDTPQAASKTITEPQYKALEQSLGSAKAAEYITKNNIAVNGKGPVPVKKVVATKKINGKTYYQLSDGQIYDNPEGR